MPTVVRVNSSSAARLRTAVGAGSLLLTLTLGSSAAATGGLAGPAGPGTGDTTVAGDATSLGGTSVGGAPEVGGTPEVGSTPSVDETPSVGDTTTGQEPDARLVVWREAPTVVQSRCTLEGSDEASSYGVPDVMGVSYRVGDHEVSGTVEVTDGDQVTVLALTYPGVRFDDDSTEAVYVLDFSRCPAPASPVAQTPVAQAPAAQAPTAPAPAAQDAPPASPSAAGPAGATPVAADGAPARTGVPATAETTSAGVISSGPGTAGPTDAPVTVLARATSAAPPSSARAERLAETGAHAWQAAALAGALLLTGSGMLAAVRRS